MNECVLVVDDDREIVKAIGLLLEKEGYRVLKAYDGLEALELAAEQPVRLIIMDVMMPRLDGLSAVMKIRERKNIPIIVLSAKSEETDKILGPFHGSRRLCGEALFTPGTGRPGEEPPAALYDAGRHPRAGREDEIRNGRLCYRPSERTLYADGEAVRLTATETKIVELLMRNAGRVFPAEEIYRRVWEEEAFLAENTVMVHIRRIREKIELNPKKPEYLKVVWGIGYKMEKMQDYR